MQRLILDDGATPGRRRSGAKLYHQGSRFGDPGARRFDRELIAKMLWLAEALDRNTREARQHGGKLKAKGRDVLRVLLIRFYNRKTGECFPSYEAIAAAAGCARSTVALALKRLQAAGILEIIRRKVVMRFRMPGERATFDAAVQDSNSYLFNFSFLDRSRHGDLGLPLLRPIAESDNRTETRNQDSKSHENGAAGVADRVSPRAISAARETAELKGLYEALLKLGTSIETGDTGK